MLLEFLANCLPLLKPPHHPLANKWELIGHSARVWHSGAPAGGSAKGPPLGVISEEECLGINTWVPNSLIRLAWFWRSAGRMMEGAGSARLEASLIEASPHLDSQLKEEVRWCRWHLLTICLGVVAGHIYLSLDIPSSPLVSSLGGQSRAPPRDAASSQQPGAQRAVHKRAHPRQVLDFGWAARWRTAAPKPREPVLRTTLDLLPGTIRAGLRGSKK